MSHPIRFKHITGVILLVVITALSGCFHEKDDDEDGITITINEGNRLVGDLETPLQYTVSVTDSSGTALPSDGVVWSSTDTGVATVDETGKVTPVAEGNTDIIATAHGVSAKVTLRIDTRVKTLNITIRYEDRIYDQNGFVAQTEYKAVRHAIVEILDENDVILETLASGEGGAVQVNVLPQTKVSARIKARTDAAQGFDLQVKDMKGSLYSVVTAFDLLNGETDFAVDIGLNSNVAGVFNILDVFVTASQFSLSLQNVTSTALTAYWQRGSDTGTFYCVGDFTVGCPRGEGIYVLNDLRFGDTDEFDDDVLYHEFAHYLAEYHSRDDSVGGCHSLGQDDLDLKLAWSEGWGDFFPLAVKAWLSADPARSTLLSSTADTSVSQYMDTVGNEVSFAFDLGNLNNNNSGAEAYYATSEFGVGRILWQLREHEMGGMDRIWQVMNTYFTDAFTVPLTPPTNLEAFWNGWLRIFDPTPDELTTLEGIFGERKVYYRLDSYEEGDDTTANPRRAVLGMVESHYLYKDPRSGKTDIDIIPFEATIGVRYVAETAGLKNGADTVIRVLDPNKLPFYEAGQAVSNDDAVPDSYYYTDPLFPECGIMYTNNDTALSSKVEFTATSTGTYYVEVKSMAVVENDPASIAGRYGTYKLVIDRL